MSANHPRKNQNALRFVLLAIAPVAAGLLASSEELRSQVSAGGPDLSVSNARRQRFSHNGTILNIGRLENVEPCAGDTDSERLFRLVMHHLDANDPTEGLRYAVRATIERLPDRLRDRLVSRLLLK